MLISYTWLNKYFDNKLPAPEKVADVLTFHAWEIESLEEVGDDTVLDVNVLPDKAMWALSHRGVARDLATILNIPMTIDPLRETVVLEPKNPHPLVEVASPNCHRFAAARLTGVKVGPSPEWLRHALEAIGQRSINNIVDASNYVMFDLGQPSHAFDADKIGDGIVVRQAKDGETLQALDATTYTFAETDTLITSKEGSPLSVAGIKGGLGSGISETTQNILVETANWNPISTRKTAARLKLRSDASARYENGIVPELVPFGLQAVVKLILEVAGGQVEGYEDIVGRKTISTPVSVSLNKLNSVLGLNLDKNEVESILRKFDWQFTNEKGVFEVVPPLERTDLNIPEDLIEEIGRIYGYEHVQAVVPPPMKAVNVNKRFFYSEQIIKVLIELGFSEIYTSSFRKQDKVKMVNAFASDKGYLRSSLVENMQEALAKNMPNADILGLRQIRLFEIGNVFSKTGESMMLSIGTRSPSGYKPKTDDIAISEALAAVCGSLGINVSVLITDGVVEFDIGTLIQTLPEQTKYQLAPVSTKTSYKPFSNYPAIARDIAMWVATGESVDQVDKVIQDAAGTLCVRTTLFDRFEKEGRVSYAYRLVFQSNEKTLTDSEVNAIMEGVYQAVSERGYETR